MERSEPDSTTRDPAVRVRQAVPADAEPIVTFNAAMARETEGRELDVDLLRRGVAALLEDPARGRYFVAEWVGPAAPTGDGAEAGVERVGAASEWARDAPSEPVGQLMITFEWSDWRNGAVWWIQSVYVAPAWRRRGVYATLHEEVRRLARESGAVGLRLYVDEDNTSARAVYRALGMQPSRYLMFEEMWAEPPETST